MKNSDTNGMEPIVAHIKNLLKEQEEKREYEYAPQIEAMREMSLGIRDVDYRAEINRVRVSRVYEEVEALKSKVRILEGKALDTEQDLALNKLGQMRAATREEDIKRALNEGYNDGFRDGFKESEKYRSDV